MRRMLTDDNGPADLYTELMKHYEGKRQKLTRLWRMKFMVSSSGLLRRVSGMHSPSLKKQNCRAGNWSIALFLPALFCDSKPGHNSDLCTVNRQASRNEAPVKGRLTDKGQTELLLICMGGTSKPNKNVPSDPTPLSSPITWVFNLGRLSKCGMARIRLLYSHSPFSGNLRSALWPRTSSNSRSAITH